VFIEDQLALDIGFDASPALQPAQPDEARAAWFPADGAE
jgi:hypothetical protein